MRKNRTKRTPRATKSSEGADTPSLPYCFIADDDLHYFAEGSHRRLWEKLGSHVTTLDGEIGTHFAVWAPNARAVSVTGPFNSWDPTANPLQPIRGGVWEGFIAGVDVGAIYKFDIVSRVGALRLEKSDPFGLAHEIPPKTASVVSTLDYTWADENWMRDRGSHQSISSPISIYEVHLGSWRRHPNGDSLSYREIAPQLAAYVRDLGFTHVELLPVTEHPYYASWGYQTTGYFAATSRYGTPQDLMFLIDTLHQEGIGVILDWVPSHFPGDGHSLGFFDGTHLFEHEDPRISYHPDWDSLIFDYGRLEVRSFLVSSAIFWLTKYHIDALRVDAVASMLYLDYSRKEGGWVANQYGGTENLEAIEFLRELNDHVHDEFPDVRMIAEESTAWPMVSRPTHIGGLGFDFKWDMGWMHDTLAYFEFDPIHRTFHHGKVTFRMVYAWSERFALPLSHDEVVHLKRSLAGRMPGDDWKKLANLRLLFAWQFGQPGKKLIFMGGEIAQWTEWNHDAQLPWELLKLPAHQGVQKLVRDLNRIYRDYPEMHEIEHTIEGFRWIDCNDTLQSVVSFERIGPEPDQSLVAVYNFTPVPRLLYRIGVPRGGTWREILNTDAFGYGGSGMGNYGKVEAKEEASHGHPWCIDLTIPPLGALFLKDDK